MKHTATSLILLLVLIAQSAALEVSIDAPGTFVVNESTPVSLHSEATDTYDVKITIVDNDNASISQINHDGWKSSFYYLSSAFPEKTSFDIRATRAAEGASLCVKLRKPRGETVFSKCIPITITGQSIRNEAITEQPSKIYLGGKRQEIVTSDGKLQASLIYATLFLAAFSTLLILFRKI